MTLSQAQVYSHVFFFKFTADELLVFLWIAGSYQVNLFKTRPGCLEGSLAALARKPVILLVVIASAVIVLALFTLFVLLPSQRVTSHLVETLRELRHDPVRKQ